MQDEPQIPQGKPHGHDLFIAPDRRAVLLALAYLFFHLFFFGDFLLLINDALTLALSPLEINLLYMATGTVILMLLMRRYLAVSLHRFREYGYKSFLDFLIGYGMRLLLSIPIIFLISAILPDFTTTPNTEGVHALAAHSFLPTMFLRLP